MECSTAGQTKKLINDTNHKYDAKWKYKYVMKYVHLLWRIKIFLNVMYRTNSLHSVWTHTHYHHTSHHKWETNREPCSVQRWFRVWFWTSYEANRTADAEKWNQELRPERDGLLDLCAQLVWEKQQVCEIMMTRLKHIWNNILTDSWQSWTLVPRSVITISSQVMMLN